MKRLLLWIVRILAGLLLFGIVAYAVVYVRSERTLHQTYDVPAVTIAVPTDPASIIEGRRLAIIHGCFGDCHGKQAEGRLMVDDPMIARIVAPNLPAAVRNYTDSQLAALIRNGVRPDGRSLIVMPSEAFVGLSDEDLGRIIAFLKTLPAVAGPGPSVAPGPLGRIGLATGKFNVAAQLIAQSVPPPEATGSIHPASAIGRGARRSQKPPHDEPVRAETLVAAHGCGDCRALQLPAHTGLCC